jgi:hypothetical protein
MAAGGIVTQRNKNFWRKDEVRGMLAFGVDRRPQADPLGVVVIEERSVTSVGDSNRPRKAAYLTS